MHYRRIIMGKHDEHYFEVSFQLLYVQKQRPALEIIEHFLEPG